MSRSHRRNILIVLLGGSVLFACGAETNLAPGTLVQSSLPRNTSPQVADADRASQTDGNTEFAFDCYRRLAAEKGNVFFSPLSISVALAMTWAGARTTTEEQMASALSFELSQARLHPYFNELDLALNSRGQGAQGKDGKGFRLRVVNAIWGQPGYEFLSSFLDVLAASYGAGMRLLDFGDAQAAADAINRWIAEQTEDRIPKLMSPEALQGDIALVLTNAVYFNAAWLRPFEKAATRDGTFSLADGTRVTVPMMRQTSAFRVGSGALARCGESSRCGPGSGYRAIELPYDGEQLAMLIVLPDAQPLDFLESQLSARTLSTILASLSSQQVDLQMPRWTFRSPVIGLRAPLEALGMKDAFVPYQADLSGMDGSRRLFLSSVLHQAFVAVDEAGTEAAAATAVSVGVTSAPPPPISFVVDQPFVYLIRDVPTGAILFVGRVVDPR